MREDQQEYMVVRAGRAGPEDLRQRTPELVALPERTIALFGVGALGGHCGLELARAGLQELRLVDEDFVDPGTVSRWVLGLGVAGLRKATALKRFIESNYPYTAVKAYHRKIGAVREPGQKPEQHLLDEILSGTSLVVDATAERGVQYFLSEVARHRNIPYLGMQATQGAWGGWLVRIVPGLTDGCWMCLEHLRAMANDEAGEGWERSFPLPPEDRREGRIQPVGCAEPTFTGAGFDLLEMVTTGVRWAVATLSREEEKGYPDVEHDVAVLRTRREDGTATLPEWKGMKLARHPMCRRCSLEVASN